MFFKPVMEKKRKRKKKKENQNYRIRTKKRLNLSCNRKSRVTCYQTRQRKGDFIEEKIGNFVYQELETKRPECVMI